MNASSTEEEEVEVVSPRRNGWSWPWHPQQLLAWFGVFLVALLYFGFLGLYIPGLYRIPFFLLPSVLLVLQIVSMAAATSINPAEASFRKKLFDVGSGGPISRPRFSRSKHKHVIENHYCNLCQVHV